VRELVLIRFCYGPFGTFGQLVAPNRELVLWTVEQPWRSNQANVSCIPEGRYTVEPYDSPKFGEVFILEGPGVRKFAVEGARWGILIHAANRAAELKGCIAPGLKLGALGGEWAVLSSKKALGELKRLVGKEQWTLRITSGRISELS